MGHGLKFNFIILDRIYRIFLSEHVNCLCVLCERYLFPLARSLESLEIAETAEKTSLMLWAKGSVYSVRDILSLARSPESLEIAETAEKARLMLWG